MSIIDNLKGECMSYTDFDFPHTHMYESDLREVLARIKKLEEVVKNFVNTEIIVFAEPITWDISRQYTKGTIVVDSEGDAFLSKKPVPAGIELNNDEYWLEIFNYIDYVKSFNSNLTINIESNTDRATNNYTIDDWLVWNNILYKVIAPINYDDLLRIDVNIERFTVEEFCRTWATYMVNTIQQYKDDIDASELAYVSAMQAEVDRILAGATVDSEVIDARLGANGVNYTTLGNAIRGQFGQTVREYYGSQISDNSVLASVNDCVTNLIYRINVSGGNTPPSDLPAGTYAHGIIYTIGWNIDGTDTKIQFWYSTANEAYYRFKWGGTWRTWNTINRNTDIDNLISEIATTVKEYNGNQITDNTVLASMDDVNLNEIYRINVASSDTPPSNLPSGAGTRGISFSIAWNLDSTDTLIQFYFTSTEDSYYRLYWGGSWKDWKLLNQDSEFTAIKCPFEEVDADMMSIIKRIIVTGASVDEYRIMISNIQRNYNSSGLNRFTIYKSDDSGANQGTLGYFSVDTATLSGSEIIDITSIGSGVQLYVEYDFTSMTVGSRITATGLTHLIKGDCYIPMVTNELPMCDFGFIQKFGVIGDSYACGAIYTPDPDNPGSYVHSNYENLSWGKILARKYGNTCTLFATGGLTTRSWLTSASGLTALLAAPAQELYFSQLGINDRSISSSYLGTIADITDFNDWHNYRDTFYGNYGKIIEQTLTHAPDAKYILMTIAYKYDTTEYNYNNAIKEIATHYNLPYIDVNVLSFYGSGSPYHVNMVQNHPTAPIYAGMANANVVLFNKMVASNYDYFKEFTS